MNLPSMVGSMNSFTEVWNGVGWTPTSRCMRMGLVMAGQFPKSIRHSDLAHGFFGCHFKKLRAKNAKGDS